MFKFLASLALILASLMGLALPANASAPLDTTTTQLQVLPPCTHEDGSIGTAPNGETIYEDCHWNGDTRGNMTGVSFNVIDGQVILLTLAPDLTLDTTEGLDALAWGLFDATNAADLLPDTATTVTFTASADVNSPITPTADTIVCTDMLGNTFEFTIS